MLTLGVLLVFLGMLSVAGVLIVLILVALAKAALR